MVSAQQMKLAWQHFMQVFLRARKQQRQVLSDYQKAVDQEKIKQVQDKLRR